MKMRRAWAGIAAVAAAALVGALGAAPVSAYAATDAASLQNEINAGGTATLENDITASVTVPEGVTVMLDLNGFTLTNVDGQHTITNNGALTITGAGTVDNVSHAHAAVYNQAGATATLGAANYTRSKEAGTSPRRAQRQQLLQRCEPGHHDHRFRRGREAGRPLLEPR
uniref:hypothetical protein n=1 Tax=Parolsenella massiliensis TaxID=1871022 RepID=UPI000933ECF0|nr:hypothetical protein [Parolsenella massiliensis]